MPGPTDLEGADRLEHFAFEQDAGAKSGVQFSLSLIALKALPVLILGGFTSVPGAIIGGMIIGVGEKLAEVYVGPIVGGAIENWFAYMLALAFLLFRPQGLFGDKIIERV